MTANLLAMASAIASKSCCSKRNLSAIPSAVLCCAEPFNWFALGHRIGDKNRPFLKMKNETNKTTEGQLLDLLKKVLPKATPDAQLAGKIYQAVELELKAKARGSAFEKFCAKVELSDL